MKTQHTNTKILKKTIKIKIMKNTKPIQNKHIKNITKSKYTNNKL